MAEIAYQSKRATLYCGDAREVLPTLDVTADLLVTDPPYGAAFKKTRSDAFPVMAGDGDKVGSTALTSAVLLLSLERLKNLRHLYVFGTFNDFAALGVPKTTMLIWDKGRPGTGNISSPWAPCFEPITFAVQTRCDFDKQHNGGLAVKMRKKAIISCPRRQGNLLHPTEKPVPLLRTLIESSSRHDELVLDPFAGSASTLVAALLEGRRAVGIEIDPTYAEVGAKRLQAVEAWLDQCCERW